MNKLKLTDLAGAPVIIFVDHIAMIRSPRPTRAYTHSEIVTDGNNGNLFVRETIDQIEAKLNGEE